MSRFTTMRPTRASSARDPAARASSARASLVLLFVALSACAGYSPGDLRPGQTEADVRARMGEPTGRYTLPDGGSQLEYARGPMGKHTYMIDVDATGRVRGWEQVLTEPRFDAIKIAEPQAEVRNGLGQPSETRVGWRGVGQVWSYRYESLFCRWFQVWLVGGRVREAAYATDPMCEEARREND
ncbi:MAG: hypothetical protein Q8L95_02000 [Burkholderiales bacterium]|nr:hypothetical protein [Burkholderiales bacterium]